MAQPCDDISDFELIRRMADQEIDLEKARDAWGRFYQRHHQFLLRICMSDYGYFLGTEEVKDLVQEAFWRALGGAATFDHAEACEPAVQERKCRRWLARIAERLVLDSHKGKPEISFLDEDEMDELGSGTTHQNPSEVQVPESARLKLLKSGFTLLSEIEQTVLRATMFWWQPGQEHQRMPHAAMEQLSRQVDRTPDAIRQIRSRAVQKLQKHVNEHLHNEKAD